MATRFYLPSTGVPTYTGIPFSGVWALSSNADRLPCVTILSGTAMTDKTTPIRSATGNVLNRQYVSAPLAAQTISGSVSGQLRGLESNAGANGFSAICIYVFQSGGTLPRGVLLTIQTGVSEYDITSINRKTPSNIALNPVTCQSGDVLVMEIGYRQTASSTNRTVTQRFGDSAASDLPVDETSTSDFNGWVEFNNNITFIGSTSFANSFVYWGQDTL